MRPGPIRTLKQIRPPSLLCNQVVVGKVSAVGVGAEFSVWLSEGKLYSAGLPQYGQLGHGERGVVGKTSGGRPLRWQGACVGDARWCLLPEGACSQHNDSSSWMVWFLATGCGRGWRSEHEMPTRKPSCTIAGTDGSYNAADSSVKVNGCGGLRRESDMPWSGIGLVWCRSLLSHGPWPVCLAPPHQGCSTHNAPALSTPPSLVPLQNTISQIVFQPQYTPKLITALAEKEVTRLACGQNHSVAVASDGGVWTWGFGGYGRLGHRVQQDEYKPRLVETLTGRLVVPPDAIVAAGQTSSFCSIVGGQLFAWGKLKVSGDNLMYPTPYLELAGWDIRSLACGSTTFAVAATYGAEKSTITW